VNQQRISVIVDLALITCASIILACEVGVSIGGAVWLLAIVFLGRMLK